MNQEEEQKAIKAGKIASEVKKWIRPQIKKDMPLLEIAEKIEDKIVALGGKPAFPTSLAIDNVAAHYTPSHDDETLARGLLKVDFGVHIDGWVADNAFSVDLENSEENKRIIEASELALEKALKTARKGSALSEIGKVVEETITEKNLEPVRDLSGHSMEQFDLHAGQSVPNFDTGSDEKTTSGLYAIEPFATNGSGRVHDGKPSGVYQIESEKSVRSPLARTILQYLIEEYDNLPFCSRWVVKKFGSKSLFGLRELERNGNIHHFAQLVDSENSAVSQAEETILIRENGEVIVTTL